MIHFTLKSAKQPNYEMAYNVLQKSISEEYGRHSYILRGSDLRPDERQRFEDIIKGNADKDDYATALAFLSRCLKKYHNSNVIILIDEYDVPLENAYFKGFYNQIIDFVRSLLESALKTNDALEFAVITGCFRISRESIFTGLNNLEVISILSQGYAEYFGFMQMEVKSLLQYYEVEEREQELKEWYDGYQFGETEVYNPWSVLNYVKEAAVYAQRFPKPYWANTSSNNIIRELIETSDSAVRAEIEQLIDGRTIEKPIHEDITYEDIHSSGGKHGKYFLHIPVTYDVEENSISDLCNVVGIDRGINFVVAAYDSNHTSGFVRGKTMKQKRANYSKLRKELQMRHTPSSRRRLKAIGHRENRWMQDINHQVSKALVERNPKHTLFVVEDLSGIRNATERVKTKDRYVSVSWSFYDLEQKLIYKAKQKQSSVIKVDPRYTSQCCPVCGHTEKSNRNKKIHLFTCKNCGYKSNDDRIGAMNLYRMGINYLADSQVPNTVVTE